MLELPAMLGVSAGTNLLGTASNFYWQYKNYNYQKSLQNRIFQREDSSMQRRVADLKAAGLSPVLAAGGSGASSGPVVSTSPPSLEGLGDLSNALQMMQAQATSASIDKTIAENDLLKKQAQKVDAEKYLTYLNAQSKAMDNEVQKSFGGNSNPSPVGKVVRDITGAGTGPLMDAVKHVGKQIQRSWNEPTPKRVSLFDRFFGKEENK